MASLKTIFTDIADAAEEVFSSADDNYFYGDRTLPNIVAQLNSIDRSYYLDLPSNYTTDYATCISALADVIRARTSFSSTLTLPEMANKIRLINGNGDQEREYLLGSRVNNKTHTEYLANRDYYFSSRIRAGQVVYVSAAGYDNVSAIVTKNTYLYYNEDIGERDTYEKTYFTTSLFTYEKDSRYSTPVVSGTVVSDPSIKFSVWVDTLNVWTPLEIYAEAWKADDAYGDIGVDIQFWKDDSDYKERYPQSIDLWADFIMDGSSASGSFRINDSYDSSTGSGSDSYSSSSYGNIILTSINGSVTGNFGGVVQTVNIRYDYPY